MLSILVVSKWLEIKIKSKGEMINSTKVYFSEKSKKFCGEHFINIWIKIPKQAANSMISHSNMIHCKFLRKDLLFICMLKIEVELNNIVSLCLFKVGINID